MLCTGKNNMVVVKLREDTPGEGSMGTKLTLLIRICKLFFAKFIVRLYLIVSPLYQNRFPIIYPVLFCIFQTQLLQVP
jgi:hypothetical protein